MSLFKEKFKYAGKAFREKVYNPQSGATLFIPINSAWRDMNVQKALGNNETYLRSILDLHLVIPKYSTKEISDSHVINVSRSSLGQAYLYRRNYVTSRLRRLRL